MGFTQFRFPSRTDNQASTLIRLNFKFSIQPFSSVRSPVRLNVLTYWSLISLSIEGSDWIHAVVLAGSLLLLLFFFFFPLGVDKIDCFRADCFFRRAGQSTFSRSFFYLGFLVLVCYSQKVATAYSRDRIGQKSLSVYPKMYLYKSQSSIFWSGTTTTLLGENTFNSGPSSGTTTLCIITKGSLLAEPTYKLQSCIQLFRERLSEKVHATIP